MAVTPGFVGSNASGSPSNPHTFTAEPIGTAASDRFVVVEVDHRTNGASPSGGVTAMTIGGISAALLSDGVHSASIVSGRNAASMWGALVPSGTTANIVITFAEAQAQIGIGVWALTGAGTSPVPSDVDTANANNIAALTVPASGAAIIGAHNGSGNSITFTNATGRYNASVGGGAIRSAGADTTTAGTNTITATNGSQVVGVAFAPFSAGSLVADPASFVLTGTAAVAKRALKVDGGSASFVLTAADVALKQTRLVTATTVSFLLAGTAAVPKQARVVVAGGAAFLLSGTDVALIKTGAAVISTESGVFLLTGGAAVPLMTQSLVGGSVAYLLSGQAADITIDSPAALLYGGVPVTAIYYGDEPIIAVYEGSSQIWP